MKRAFENLKLRKEKGMLLPAPLKEIHPIIGTKELLSKGKEVIPEKAKEVIGKEKDAVLHGVKGVGHFTSRKIDDLRNFNVRQFGRETWGALKIVGTRTLGKIRREAPLVTQMKVNKISERSFVPKAKVDEKAAIEKVEASRAEAKNQEVVIENPDGTKTTATRLWSIDDESIK